jgi:hypothetical protein
MLTPVQQTPLPLDPARQQITPSPPVAAPAPPRAADVPVQPSTAPKDKFNPKDADRGSSGQYRARDNQKRAAIAGKLRAAYQRLIQLQTSAWAALKAGDAQWAKEAAQEAAYVATTIYETATALPVSDIDSIVLEANRLVSSSAATGGDSSGSSSFSAGDSNAGDTSVPTSLDIAWAGLGVAKDVMDTAASVPTQPFEDRVAISAMKKTVLGAMAGVETFAAKLAKAMGGVQISSGSERIDINV